MAPKLLEEVYTDLDLEKGVIVRPTYLSICKADQRYYFGKRAPEVIEQKLPMALIHESIGTIVKDNTGTYNVGDNVVMIPNLPMKADDFIGENKIRYFNFVSESGDGVSSYQYELKYLLNENYTNPILQRKSGNSF